RTTLAGNVVPFCAQLSRHSNSSSLVNFVRLCSKSIALQHSMSMLPMLHWFSPKLIGTPANAPPKSTSKRTNDARRCFIAKTTLEPTLNQRQGLLQTGRGLTQRRAQFVQRDGPTVLVSSPSCLSYCTNRRSSHAFRKTSSLSCRISRDSSCHTNHHSNRLCQSPWCGSSCCLSSSCRMNRRNSRPCQWPSCDSSSHPFLSSETNQYSNCSTRLSCRRWFGSRSAPPKHRPAQLSVPARGRE